jgi:hypothetical protein
MEAIFSTIWKSSFLYSLKTYSAVRADDLSHVAILIGGEVDGERGILARCAMVEEYRIGNTRSLRKSKTRIVTGFARAIITVQIAGTK